VRCARDIARAPRSAGTKRAVVPSLKVMAALRAAGPPAEIPNLEIRPGVEDYNMESLFAVGGASLGA